MEGKMAETSSSESVSTRLQRVAELARSRPEIALTTLAHHIDIALLHEAWHATRKGGAAGVDGQTAEQYAEHLESNLEGLLNRFTSGTYKAPPVRRVHIPKGDGSKTRPIGIPTLEDKVLQRAVTMVLEAVYEQDFRDCSFGFRPRRSAQDALSVLRAGVMEMHGGWVIDLDIRSFFDSLDHQQLRAFLDQRVRDGVIRRAIDKWLKAGVYEDGAVRRSELGSPQGGVISPLLANVFLHHVLDTWFEDVVVPRLRGRAFLVRYADDAIIVCRHEGDARRVMQVLPKRFGKYGLTLHPEKTRLVNFTRPPYRPSGKRASRPGSFDFLGFTHIWRRSQRGNWVVGQVTAKSRRTRTLRRLADWCRQNRHRPLLVQHEVLSSKLRGHYAYFGLTGNIRALGHVYWKAVRIWRYWLNRRAQRRDLSWPRFRRIFERYPLPRPRLVRSIYRSAASPTS